MQSETEGKKTPPRAFISYSWSTPRHKDWVLDFANELRAGWGIDAILDQTHLREGDDAIAFMEQMVTDETINKVFLICDCEYASKANSRKGGAGTEAQILTPEIYNQSLESGKRKYVAVVREYNDHNKPCVPTFYGGRLYVDLTDESRRAEKMETLARWAFDAPLHEPADLGHTPQFVVDRNAPTLGTQGLQQRVINSIEQGRGEAVGIAETYFRTFARNIIRYAIEAGLRGQAGPQIMAGIESLKEPRDEAERILLSLFQYCQGDERAHRVVRRFIEYLMPYTDNDLLQAEVRLDEGQLQPFSFFVPEIFRIAVASLIRVEDFHGVGLLTGELYTAPRAGGVRSGDVARPFPSLQLGVQYVEVNALLPAIRRVSGFGLTLNELAQADLLLAIISYGHLNQQETNGLLASFWYPDILHVVASRRREPFPIFARASSKRYAERLTQGLGFTLDEFQGAIDRAQSRLGNGDRMISYNDITNKSKLASAA